MWHGNCCRKAKIYTISNLRILFNFNIGEIFQADVLLIFIYMRGKIYICRLERNYDMYE